MASNLEELTENDVESLSTIFKSGLDLYNKIINNQEPTNSPDVQMDIKRAMKIFEKSTLLVSLSSIFSTNESIEEMATNDLQYFLLPALLGSLTLKLTTGERKDIVDVAEIYFKDFLLRCNQYGLCNYDLKPEKPNEEQQIALKDRSDFEILTSSVNTRANKIQRFKEQKELKSKLADMKANIENEHADEDIKRNYFLTMIRLSIFEAVDEITSINMEKPILEVMANIKKDDKPSNAKRPAPKPLKPIIITRDDVQKAVYGAGYPSLPTMTVAEFYEKRVADGIFPDPTKKPTGPLSLQQASLAGVPAFDDDKDDAEKEKKEEDDDDENLARMRAKDEFKDEHRRGWGNRMNRS